MEYRLDDYLKRQDELAIEDGEADALVYCHVHGGYVPADAMPPLPAMMCAWCENDLWDVNEFTPRCEAIKAEQAERAKITVEDIWGG